MRIALVSDLSPVPLSAGPLVLYRHFARMREHELLVVSGEIPEPDPADRHWRVVRLPRRLGALRRPSTLPLFEEWRAGQIEAEAKAVLDEFRPNVILTVWMWEYLLAAARIAERRRTPLALICHDDLEMNLAAAHPRYVRGWARRRLSRVYRQAAVRLCVSAPMEAEFAARYGAGGTVLPPLGEVSPAAERPTGERPDGSGLAVGFAGSVAGGNREPLLRLADLLHAGGGTLRLTSATTGGEREAVQAHPAVEDGGFFERPLEMHAYFREKADAMVVVQSFAAADRDAVTVNFPSKLIEAATIGLPLLVVAPPYGSAARWARENPAAAVLVEALDEGALKAAIARLGAADARAGLASGLRGVVERDLDPARIHGTFEAALRTAATA